MTHGVTGTPTPIGTPGSGGREDFLLPALVIAIALVISALIVSMGIVRAAGKRLTAGASPSVDAARLARRNDRE